MGNRAIIKRRLDPDIFKKFLEDHNISIRQLGELCDTTERTIRRCLKCKEVTLTIAIDLCTFFKCNFDQLFGKDDSPQWRAEVVKILKQVR